MGAKVYADRLIPDAVDDGGDPQTPGPAVLDGGDPQTPGPAGPELEAEVQAVAAWFEALPAEWQRYFDHEAQSGRRAYGRA